jgi:hypothetical protein
VIVFVVAFVLIGASNVMSRRGDSTKPSQSTKRRPGKTAPKAVGPTTRNDPLIDDERAEIQAILKKRGIS